MGRAAMQRANVSLVAIRRSPSLWNLVASFRPAETEQRLKNGVCCRCRARDHSRRQSHFARPHPCCKSQARARWSGRRRSHRTRCVPVPRRSWRSSPPHDLRKDASRAGGMNGEVRQGRASRIMLNGVSAARRTLEKPPLTMTSRSFASPAWAPSAAPTSCDLDVGRQIIVEAA
jgi:hypothetical protein